METNIYIQNEATKKIITYVPCKNCNIYNHIDAKTKCNNICQQNDPNKPYTFTGKWKTNINNHQDQICQCNKIGQLNKEYIGCPLHTRCFIWNDSEAQVDCPKLCNKYLHNKNPSWTGNWKSTSIDTSACECQSYY